MHDEPLTWAEVVERGLVERQRWEQVTSIALELFRRGQEVAASAGLILADTKYEFGLTSDDELLLIDEVHTPDSSRFWVADSYEERLAAGEEPESLDKEVVRRALADAGFTGDGDAPDLPDGGVDGDVGALHRRLRAADGSGVRARRRTDRGTNCRRWRIAMSMRASERQ